MARYPKEIKMKVVAVLYELDSSGDATPGAIAEIARDRGINANVVY
jgi:transposase-like protein